MIASIRACPKAPRTCLLDEQRRAATSPACDRSVIFFCALSITASRSCSLLQPVHGLVRGVGHRLADPARHMASSRSLTVRASSDCRPASTSPMVCSRPAVSDWTCAHLAEMRSSQLFRADRLPFGIAPAGARSPHHDDDHGQHHRHQQRRAQHQRRAHA